MKALRLLTAMTATASVVAAAPRQELRLQDHIGHTWTDELVSFPLQPDLKDAKTVAVTDAAGQPVPCQVADGRVYLQVTLPADTELRFAVGLDGARPPPAKPASVSEADGLLTLDSGAMALRLPAGVREFPQPVAAREVPGPLHGVRGAQGGWIGRSWLDAPAKITSCRTTVTADGPLFAEATVDYTFEGDRHYRFTVRVVAGQTAAVISESMDLNPGNRYVLLQYANDADASSWEWWNLADSAHMLPGQAQAEQPANAVFSFYAGLEPNQCRWMGGRPTHPRKGVDAAGQPAIMQETGELHAPLTYEQDERFNRLTGWWLNSFSDRSYAFSLYNDKRPDAPVVSVLMGRPSRNVNPHMDPPPEPWVRIVTGLNDLRIWTHREKDLRVLAPICLGTREWLLMVEPQSALRPLGDKQSPNTFRQVLKHSWFPLDKVKDWTFDWPEPEHAWPRLFCAAGDLPAMQARVAAATGEMAKSALIPAIYRTGGTPEAMAKQALPLLEGAVKGALGADGHGSVNWFHASLHMMQAMPVWEAAMATPGLDPALRTRLKAYGAFIAHRAWDNDYWPPKDTGNGWGSANMGTLAAGARVLCAAAMAGHPDQPRWLARSRGYLDGNLQGLLGPDGSGLSCPHYLGASADPVLYMALALKYGGGYDAFAQDPRWASFCQFMIDILTPPDPRSPLGGHPYGLPLGAPVDATARHRRNLWPLGHTSRTETSGILDMLALGMQGHNEPLAGALRFMSAEMGANSSGAFVAYALLANTTSPLAPPDLRSRWYPYYGAILRDGRPGESWLAIRYSKFAFDHFQADMGAFTLFARGVPLMLDFGSMYSPENGQPVYHNRVSWDVRESTPKPCPGNQQEGCFYRGLTYFEHTVEPWTCKTESFGEGQSPTDAFGEITAFASLPGSDFLLGRTEVRTLQTLPYFETTAAALAPDPNQRRVLESVPPFAWERRLLFARDTDPARPSFLLVRDDFVGQSPPALLSYWVMADELTFDGSQAKAKGQFGVDLQFVALQPAAPAFARWQWEHTNWGGERQLCIRVPSPDGKPVLVLLYPHARGETLPTFTRIADGQGVCLGAADGSAVYAFLAPGQVTFESPGVRFVATAGILRTAGDKAWIALPQGGAAVVAGVTLTCNAATEATLAPGSIELRTDGAAQPLLLGGRLPKRLKVTLDGQPLDVKVRKGTLTLGVPAGTHTLRIQGRK